MPILSSPDTRRFKTNNGVFLFSIKSPHHRYRSFFYFFFFFFLNHCSISPKQPSKCVTTFRLTRHLSFFFFFFFFFLTVDNDDHLFGSLEFSAISMNQAKYNLFLSALALAIFSTKLFLLIPLTLLQCLSRKYLSWYAIFPLYKPATTETMTYPTGIWHLYLSLLMMQQ